MLRITAALIVALAGTRVCLAAPYPFDVTKLTAPDGSITAKFVSIGATLTELWVKDKFGNARDIVLGYDNNTLLLTDPIHPVFNPIVGRYANRIKNGTFSIPITKYPQPPGPNVYHIPLSDPNGQVWCAKSYDTPIFMTGLQSTLHGGKIGWDRGNWTIVERTPTRVVCKHFDPADEGFPGNVTAYATHEVHNGGILWTTVRARATQKTPIKLTQHIYWNLDAFQNGSEDILEHHLKIDGSRTIVVDSNLVPTGPFLDVKNTTYDFRRERETGFYWRDRCESGCQGYDTAWVYDKTEDVHPRASLWSDVSGIRVDFISNQPAVQIYTPALLQIPRKVVHGGPNIDYGRWSAVAIEQEGYIAAINTPEWHVDQIYNPGKDFEWSTTYRFSVVS